jgi:hypothetical protein
MGPQLFDKAGRQSSLCNGDKCWTPPDELTARHLVNAHAIHAIIVHEVDCDRMGVVFGFFRGTVAQSRART